MLPFSFNYALLLNVGEASATILSVERLNAQSAVCTIATQKEKSLKDSCMHGVILFVSGTKLSLCESHIRLSVSARQPRFLFLQI